MYADSSEQGDKDEHRPLEQEWEGPLILVVNVETSGPCGEKVCEEKTDGACNSRSRLGACISNPNRFTRPANFEQAQLTYGPAYYSSYCCG